MNEKIVLGLSYTDNGIKVTSDRIHSYHTHTHMYNELLLYEAFDGHITVNNERITVNAPTVLLVTPSDFHSTYAESSCQSHYIKIAFVDGITDEYISSSLSRPILFNEENPLLHLLIKRCSDDGLDIDCKRIFLNAILLELIKNGRCLGHEEKKGSELTVLQAVKRINSSFYEKVTLKATAAELRVTPQYLSNVFIRHMNIGFSEYLCNKRLTYAASLLASKKLTVTEVCYACGYSNLSHFLRSFKKKYGVYPKEYKSKN